MKVTFRSLMERATETGEKFIGSYVMTPMLTEIEIMKMGGVDFVILDLEHESLTFTDLRPMLLMAESCGLATLIRVPGIDEGAIKKALDMGASGIKVPGVSTAEQARQVVAYAKYPPEGVRGGCSFTRDNGYGQDPTKCFERANKETVVSVILEGIEGIENMEDIIATPGIDTISVGNADLANFLGVPGERYHPKVLKAGIEAAELCVKYGKTCSAQVSYPEDAKKYKDIKGITHFHIDDLPPFILRAYKELCNGLHENSK